MLKKQLTALTELKFRSVITDVLLVVNAFVWYYVVFALFLQTIIPKISGAGFSSAILIWGLHFGGLIISAVAGTFVSKKIKHRHLIILWMILGTLSSIAIVLVNPSNIWQVSLIGVILGISLGIGMPACIGRYSDSIPVENRGRISGITLFVSGIGIAAFSIVGISEILILGIVLAVWRLSGLIIYLLVKAPSSPPLTAKKSNSQYTKVFGQHSFILYFIPWVMFSLINYLVAPSSPTLGASESWNLTLVQTGFMGLFALLGGFFIDSMGRKRVAVTGFILLGLGTALLGISSSDLTILYFNAIVDGIAWGFLLVLFILTVWGDLSFGTSSDKYYAVGVIPFFISNFLGLTVGSYISSYFTGYRASELFSFGAFFLFLAVLPLIYTPETLPEKSIKDRDLKSYVEKARKAALKEEVKNKKKEEPPKARKDENEENNEEYNEARKLAEKYY
ncbi:MAG: MFS transporter [Candidatus Bathyarchaeia archaeon]|jgi:MFS family permease